MVTTYPWTNLTGQETQGKYPWSNLTLDETVPPVVTSPGLNATDQVFKNIFPDKDPSEIYSYISENPEGFIGDLQGKGWTEDTEAVIRLFVPEIGNEELQGLFGAIAPYKAEYPFKDDFIDPLWGGAVGFGQDTKTRLLSTFPSVLETWGGKLKEWGYEILSIPAQVVSFLDLIAEGKSIEEARDSAKETGHEFVEPITLTTDEVISRILPSIQEAAEQNFIRLTEEHRVWWEEHPELAPDPKYALNPYENPELLKDPGYYVYSFSSSLAYSLTVMGTMVVVSAIGTPAAGIPAGIMVASGPEATAMTTELLNQGVPFQEAAQWGELYGLAAGGIEVASGLFLLGLTTKPFRGIILPFQKLMLQITANNIVKGIAAGVITVGTEGIEEVMTQAVHNVIMQQYDETQKITDGMSHAFIQGVIASLPFGVLGGYASSRTFRNSLSPDTMEYYDRLVARFQEHGLSLGQAEVQATKELARIKEDEVSKALEISRNEYLEAQGVTSVEELGTTLIEEGTITGEVTTGIEYAPTQAMAEGETVTGEVPAVEFNPIVTKVGKGYEILQAGELVGEISYATNIPGVNGIVIDRIDIVETAQRQGLATQAIQRVLREAEASGVPLYTGMMEPDGVQLFNALEQRGIVSLTPAPQRMLGETVTRGVPEYAPTTAMAEGETVSGVPPPISPMGVALGRSDNKWKGFMADLQDANTVAKVAFRPDMLRKIVNAIPGVRDFFGAVAPNVVANTPSGKYHIIRSTLYDECGHKTQGVMSHLWEVGPQKKVFGEQDENFIIKSGPLKGQTVGDIALQRGRWEAKLTPEQKLWLDRANLIEQSTTEYLERNDIPVGRISLEEGGQFAAARVYKRELNDGTIVNIGYVSAKPGRPGAKLPTEKHRTFVTDAEALEAGYHRIPYEEALSIRVNGAYKRVADKQAANWLLTQVPWRTTAAPEELVLAAEAAKLKLRHSQMLLAALNRAVRGERIPPATINAIRASYPDQAQQLRDLIPKLQLGESTAQEVQRQTAVAKGLVSTNQMLQARAISARARAREVALTVKVGEATIPAPAFSGKVLTGSDAQETARAVTRSFDPSFSRTLNEFNKFNAVSRFFMLAGDISPFMIQLIWGMGYPKQYARAFLGSLHAIFDPRFLASQLARFKDVIDRHPNLILTFRGQTEMTEAMGKGGWLSGDVDLTPAGEKRLKTYGLFIPRMTGKTGAFLLTPFQRAFEGALDLMGLYLAMAYEHTAKTPAEIADLDAWINDFRGLFSTTRTGVSPKVRQAERAAILAPQYNRGIASWLWSLARGGLRGKMARQSFARGLTAIVLMTVLISLLRRESPEEIVEHLNPTSPNFMTWDIAGQRVGPGSKVRSLLKWWAQSIENPDDLLELSMDNPSVRFLRGNASPVVGASVDLITGRSYIGDPTRDGLLSFSEEIIAGNLLPIWVQSALMEGGDPGGRTVRGLAEFFGWRAYPESVWGEVGQLRDKYAHQDFNVAYTELNREQTDQLLENHPDLRELETKARVESAERGDEFEHAFYLMKEEVIAGRNEDLEEAATLLLDGTISKYEYDKTRGYARPYYSGGMAVLYGLRDVLDPKAVRDIQEWMGENQKEEDAALDEYQEHRANLIGQAELPIDWDAIETKCGTFLSKYPRNVQDYIKRNLNRWINDLPENARQIELMRLRGIEDDTWWDNYRGATGTTYPWSGLSQIPSAGSEGNRPWSGLSG